MKWIVNDNCVGCGHCTKICPEVFSVGDKGIAEIDQDEVEKFPKALQKAVMECQFSAIDSEE